MCLETEVTETLEWANKVAVRNRTSSLKILVLFDEYYKEFKSTKKAKQFVEIHLYTYKGGSYEVC